MKKMRLLLALLFVAPFILRGQSSTTTPVFPKIYAIFQNKCVSCHSNALKTGGLDLEGTGANAAEKQSAVMKNLVNVAPTNAAAAAKNYKRIYEGRPDRSFLFHKINADFDPYYPAIGANEGVSEASRLTKVEKEFIRQWILFGATSAAIVPEERVLAFYDTVGRGLAAFPTPPPAPAANEGFQLRIGPFFLAPRGTVGVPPRPRGPGRAR